MEGEPGGSPDVDDEDATLAALIRPQWRGSREAPRTGEWAASQGLVWPPQWRGSREAPRTNQWIRGALSTPRAAMEGEPGGSPDTRSRTRSGSRPTGPQWRGSREAPRTLLAVEIDGLVHSPQWRGSREAPRTGRPARLCGRFRSRNGGGAGRLPGLHAHDPPFGPGRTAAMEGEPGGSPDVRR